ncbi:MAG TPA: OmpA family protein [Chitinophagaceae bacterium]|jgi:outer membrane protein OmpA-like peptidoglycan-associated protein|nr:OmpA family protein [Chitinophagaceae bacterium]
MLRKALSVLPFSFLCFAGYAQPGKTVKSADTVKTAQVIVTVVNDMKQPRKGEQVIFQCAATKQSYTARTAANGKVTFTLPAGKDYTVTLKALTDSTQYGSLSVPPLGPGEYFKDPLTVDITYEPAREFVLRGLQFDVNKATIRLSSLPQLQDLFDYLQWKTDVRVEIAGHTDNVGKDADNLVLSQQRADAVKAWLVKKGIAASRIIAKGYGATQPIADNDTDEGRQRNRRTEVKVL